MPSDALLRPWFLVRASRFRLGQPRPEGDAEIVVPGDDPIRVLVAGAGLAAGYGVRTHAESLAGALAARLAEATGRGAAVRVHVRPTLPAQRVSSEIGPDELRERPFVVFAPCFLEVAFGRGRSLRRCADAIQRHLVDVADDGVEVAVVGLPRPARFSRLNLAAARTADRLNGALRAAAGRAARVHFVEAPVFAGVRDPRPFDAEYYADLAASVAERILALPGAAPRGA